MTASYRSLAKEPDPLIKHWYAHFGEPLRRGEGMVFRWACSRWNKGVEGYMCRYTILLRFSKNGSIT